MVEEPDAIEKQDISELTAHVKFDLPFCLYLEAGTYEVSRGNWTASVHLERVNQDHLDPRLGIARSSAELKRDRHGRLRYSRVVVELPARDIIEVELRRRYAAGEIETDEGFVNLNLTQDAIISDYSTVAYEEALAAVNRLIEVYRHVTNQFHITRVPADEVYRADIQWHQEGELFGGIGQFGFGQGLTIEPPPPDPETLQQLHSWLEKTEEIPLPWELFDDAKDRLDRGDVRQAVIEARTALEVFLDQVLLGYFGSSGNSLEESGKILAVDVSRNNIQDLEEALQLSTINRKLGHALKEAIGLDLHDGSSGLWKKWLVAKELREKAIHRGQSINRNIAAEAVVCMGEIINEMRHALHSASWMGDERDSGEV